MKNSQTGLIVIAIMIFIALVTIAAVLYYKNAPSTVIIINSSNVQQYSNLTDEHGCRVGEGYSWCSSKNACLRPWEESCNLIENVSIAENLTENVSMTNNLTINVSIANASVNSSTQQNLSPPIYDINILNAINNSLISLNGTTYYCNYHLPYPDRNCTPGDILAVDTVTICKPGYERTIPNPSQALADQVYSIYHINRSTQIILDNQIPISLGGATDILNLWPEPVTPYPGAFQKDAVEQYLHNLVCNGQMDLSTAQYEINYNWVSYNRIAGTPSSTNTTTGSGDLVG